MTHRGKDTVQNTEKCAQCLGRASMLRTGLYLVPGSLVLRWSWSPPSGPGAVIWRQLSGPSPLILYQALQSLFVIIYAACSVVLTCKRLGKRWRPPVAQQYSARLVEIHCVRKFIFFFLPIKPMHKFYSNHTFSHAFAFSRNSVWYVWYVN